MVVLVKILIVVTKCHNQKASWGERVDEKIGGRIRYDRRQEKGSKDQKNKWKCEHGPGGQGDWVDANI